MRKSKSKKFWQFQAVKDNPKEGELMLYGPISSVTWWDDEVTPQQFKKDLDALGDIETLNIFINSDGGDVFAGQAIYSMLVRHKAVKNVYIDGLAASIASLIAMAGDKVIMPANAMMMVHDPWTIAMGNANDFRKLADDMDKIRDAMLVTYETKTGMERQEIIDLLDAETWMTAEEAVKMGFADEIEQTKEIAASLDKNRLIINGLEFDLSKFHNPPKVAAAAVLPPSEPQGHGIKSKGRTLSAANEAKITEARDSLDEVLSQLSEEDDNTQNSLPLPDPLPGPGKRTTKDKQTDNGLLSLCLSQIQVNKNKLRRKANV